MRGKKSPANPWGAATLEWRIASPPPHENPAAPAVVGDCYDFDEVPLDEIVPKTFGGESSHERSSSDRRDPEP